MVTFNFIEFGENLGTRPLGKHIREQLIPLLQQEELVILDTIAQTEDKKIDKLKFLSVADVFAEAIKRIYDDTSISEIFD